MSLTPQEIIAAAIDCCDHIHTDGTGDQYVFRRGDALEFAAELTKRATPAAASAGAAGTIDTPQFREKLSDLCYPWQDPDSARKAEQAFIAHIDQHTAAAVAEAHAQGLKEGFANAEWSLGRAATAPVNAVPRISERDVADLETFKEHLADVSAGIETVKGMLGLSTGAPVSAAEQAAELEAARAEWAHSIDGAASPLVHRIANMIHAIQIGGRPSELLLYLRDWLRDERAKQAATTPSKGE